MEHVYLTRERRTSQIESATPRPLHARGVVARSIPLQQLQRTIGNRAVGQLLQSRARQGALLAVQRVGGEKIGFELPDSADTDVQAGQQLLRDEWERIRKEEHDLKVGTEKTNVATAAQETIAIRKRNTERKEYENQQRLEPSKYPERVDVKFPIIPATKTGKFGFSQYYYGQLTHKPRLDQRKMLTTRSRAFITNQLTIGADGKIKYRSARDQPYKEIGTFKQGSDVFTLTAAQGTAQNARDIYQKHGVTLGSNTAEDKEYVKDSRDVWTRRYAYVEKNYWQMMDFFATGRHEGRFQSYMRAAGEATPDIYETRDELVDIVRPTGTPPGRLTREQMAVAHQKLGSGPQQRGVSLTATPKVGVTYVNTGENFRTEEGFRLKIDLAKIPLESASGPVFINHYSAGGVIDVPAQYSTVRERGGATGNYPYKESAVHARELYLEYLKPEWIVAIESHPSVTTTGTTIAEGGDLQGHASLFELGKALFGARSYQTGFDFGLTHDSKPSAATDTDYDKGFKGARLFVRGWTAGEATFRSVGRDDATAARTAGLTVAQYRYDQLMALPVTDKEEEYDLYRLGYLQGRSGQAQIGSSAGLRF